MEEEKVEKPKFPLEPSETLKFFKSGLSEYEEEEVGDFKMIFYLGAKPS